MTKVIALRVASSPAPARARGRGGVFCALGAVLLLAACAPKGEALYARAEHSLDEGQTRAAVIDLKNLVQAEPQNAKARALLGAALVQSGDLQGGTIEIQKARDLGAPADVLLVAECQLLSARGEFDKVLSQCSPEKAPAAARVSLQIAQGQALLGLERAAEAKVQFQPALAAKPGSADALLGLAAASYQTGGLAEARSVLEKAPESVRKQPRYWMTAGRIDLEGGDLAGAEAAYQQALDLASKDKKGAERLTALGALAETQMRQGKIKEAEATSALLIKAAPDNPMVKQLRGQVAAAAGNLDEARSLLEEAVAAMPDNYQARTLLGVVNLQQGNLGQAEMHFANVVANHPSDVRAQRLLAETRAKSQTPEETLASLKPSLAQANADPSLLAMAGRLSLASGDREQGLAYLAQASTQAAEADSKSDSPEVQIDLASSYLMAGDMKRAVEILEAMPQGGPTGYQREYLLMVALLQQGQKDKAVAETKALLQRSGKDPAVRNLAAAVFLAAGDPGAARQQLNEALKLKPGDQQTLLSLGRLDIAEGKTVDAEKDFQKILQADPKNLLATLGVAVSFATRGDSKQAEKWLQKAVTDHPDSVDARLALVEFYIGAKDYGKAGAVLDEAAKLAPNNGAISNARGLLQLGTNDVRGALASFKKATEQAPGAAGYSLNLARAYLLNRDLDGALGVLNGMLKVDPKSVPALTTAAVACLQAGEVEKAAGYVERLHQAAPDAPATLAMEGDLAMAQKRYGDALDLYRKASANGTNRNLVMGQYRAGVLSGVAMPYKVLEDWLAANPKDAGVIAVLGDDRQRRGDVDGAAKLYEQGLVDVPGNAVLLNNLAVIYQSKGNPKALELAKKAFEAAPKVAAIQDTYGWALFQNGDYDQALNLLGEAAKAMPDNAEVQYHYAAALAQKGNKAEAAELLRKAIKGQLPAEARPEAQKLLQQLSN